MNPGGSVIRQGRHGSENISTFVHLDFIGVTFLGHSIYINALKVIICALKSIKFLLSKMESVILFKCPLTTVIYNLEKIINFLLQN